MKTNKQIFSKFEKVNLSEVLKKSSQVLSSNLSSDCVPSDRLCLDRVTWSGCLTWSSGGHFLAPFKYNLVLGWLIFKKTLSPVVNYLGSQLFITITDILPALVYTLARVILISIILCIAVVFMNVRGPFLFPSFHYTPK